MAQIYIASENELKQGFFNEPNPLVILIDNEIPNTPHRLLFQTYLLLDNFLRFAHDAGSGYPDSIHTVIPDKTPTYVYHRIPDEITLLQEQLDLRQHESKNELQTGHLADQAYLFLLGKITSQN